MADHRISLTEAITLTTRYRSERSNMLTPEYAGALPFSETFDKAAFNLLTDTPACAYIRCYLGMDDTGVIRLIFVAVNDAGEDILPPNDGAVIIEQGSHCPPTCPAPGPLTT